VWNFGRPAAVEVDERAFRPGIRPVHGRVACAAVENAVNGSAFAYLAADEGAVRASVALAYLHDEEAMVQAARALSELTHFDPDAGDARVLWCCAIRHAVLTGTLDIRIGLRHIESGRRDIWAKRLDAISGCGRAT
jgi:ADP-ribosylglycohydrolase